MALRLGYLLLLLSLLVPAVPLPAFGDETEAFSQSQRAALLAYARDCLLAQLDGTSPPAPPTIASHRQRACFVTFFLGKRVFACFGGFAPRRADLGSEIAENVRLALKNDRRSRSIRLEAAQSAGVQITFPQSQPEPVADYRVIDPQREGMFVDRGDSGVAFVPGEARTAAWAFREALRRLGGADAATVRVYRFKATAISTKYEIPRSTP